MKSHIIFFGFRYKNSSPEILEKSLKEILDIVQFKLFYFLSQ